MRIPAESLSGTSVRDKVVTAAEAVRLIRDGDWVVVEGFVGQCFAEELTLALEQRFLLTGAPRDLGLVFTVAPGNRQGRGLDRLCHEGLLKRAVGGHWGLSPELGKMAVGNKIEAHNLPQGVVSQLFRDTAAGKPGLLTRVGLGTFVDPRHGGGKINERTTEDRVELITLGGAEYLFYKALPLDVAFLRGTTADPEGNITMEREALTMEALAVATAVHNAGGLVIVQVERVADSGSLSPREVKIPGILVDCVVVSQPGHHWQTFGTPYSAALSGELRRVRNTVPPLELTARKVIARRAAMELRPDSTVNLGIGIPEGVANVAAEERILDYLTLTAEPGPMGGMPAAGLDFGSAVNAQAILDQPSQFDFYDGGGLDAAVLGMAQADRLGNVNVSRFGPKLAGSGGFINISQNAKRLVFTGTFVVPSRCSVQDGRLVIADGAVAPKFLADVEQRTFSGQYASAAGQPVLYVTERCVFQLTPDGLELTEIAPGVDLERDVLAHIGFEPIIGGEPKLMDARIFAAGPMGLKDDLLTMPLEARFAYDAGRNIFFLNMEGMSLVSEDEVQAIGTEVGTRLAVIGKKVQMVINYDNFYLDPALADDYKALIRSLAERYYASATRYTTSSFMRLKLSEHLSDRGLAPHIYESRQEAMNWLGNRHRTRQPRTGEKNPKKQANEAIARRPSSSQALPTVPNGLSRSSRSAPRSQTTRCAGSPDEPESRTPSTRSSRPIVRVSAGESTQMEVKKPTCLRQLNQWPSSVVDSWERASRSPPRSQASPSSSASCRSSSTPCARLEKSLGGAVKRGRLDAGQRDAALANITFTSDMKDVAGYDLVIEAVPENLDLKLSIMKSLDQIVSPDTILASNTSSIPIAQLGGMVSNPERVVGLHFFSNCGGDERMP